MTTNVDPVLVDRAMKFGRERTIPSYCSVFSFISNTGLRPNLGDGNSSQSERPAILHSWQTKAKEAYGHDL